MQKHPEAVSIRCGRCGGNFGFVPLPGNARCPYCAFEQPVSRELLAELSRYAGAVGGDLARADQAYGRAAAWQQWADQSDRVIPRLKLIIPLMSALTLLVGLGFPLSAELGIPPHQAATVLVPLLVVPSALLMVYVIWQYAGRSPAAKRARAGQVSVACPNCGAMSEIVAGAPSQTCGYCKTALIASRPVMRRGMDAAELAYRRARIEEFRQERLGMVGLWRYDATPYLPYIIFGSFVLPLGGGCIALTVEMLKGEESYSAAAFFLWVMFIGVVGVFIGTQVQRRSRRAGYQAAVADLGRQFPLRQLPDPGAVVDWLNRFWPAKYDVAALVAGPFFVAASLEAFGYLALLNGDFTDGEQRKSRLHLPLSASHPHAELLGAVDSARTIQAALARCRELGFEVSRTEAGRFAAADAETLRRIAKNPAMLHLVAPVFGALASAAAAAGSVPDAA